MLPFSNEHMEIRKLENHSSDDVSLLVVRFDTSIAEIAAHALLSLARCDSFEKMIQSPKNEDEVLSEAIRRLWIKDDAGRKILSPKGSGYVGAATAIALLTLFENIPDGKMPSTDEGAVSPACMAHTSLQVAMAFLETLHNQRQGNFAEGPTRKAEV